MSMNVAAAGKCRGNAVDWDEYVDFLDMLGIRNGDRIAPDPDPVRLEMPLPKAQVSVVSQQAASVDIRLRPKHSTAPEALRNLAPIPVAEPAKKPRSAPPPRPVRECGTETAAKRHRRLGEVDANGQLLCQTCLDGRRARNGNLNRDFQPCGTAAAYQRHMKADGRVTCQPCRDAHSSASSERRAKRRAARAAAKATA